MTLLTTYDKYQPRIRALVNSRELLLWRVQVRRGFVPVHGKDVSATAVIGVEFTSAQIEKEGKQS